jgi:hypothetical protein
MERLPPSVVGLRSINAEAEAPLDQTLAGAIISEAHGAARAPRYSCATLPDLRAFPAIQAPMELSLRN